MKAIFEAVTLGVLFYVMWIVLAMLAEIMGG